MNISEVDVDVDVGELPPLPPYICMGVNLNHIRPHTDIISPYPPLMGYRDPIPIPASNGVDICKYPQPW